MGGSFTITIAPDGSDFKVDVDGVVGSKCSDMTKVFEIGSIVEAEKKAEFYVEDETAITIDGVG